jgi:hypothetical protein
MSGWQVRNHGIIQIRRYPRSREAELLAGPAGAMPSPSIERTSSRRLRRLPAAAHAEHQNLSTESAMESRRLRVGQPIAPEQFDELTDEQLARLVPRAYREFFPGKDFCTDGHFYLHDGTAWSFYKAGFLDE